MIEDIECLAGYVRPHVLFVDDLIRHAEDYRNHLAEPFTLYIPDMSYDLATDEYYYDKIGMSQLLDSIGRLSDIADLDVEWTAEQNKGYKFNVTERYVLKPETQRIVAAELDAFIARATKIRDARIAEKEAAKRAYEEEKARLLDGVEWTIKEKVISDEGGKTKEYEHHVIVNGRDYMFIERNIFDFGRVINPNGRGLVDHDSATDRYYTEKFIDNKGWIRDREMSDDEVRAYMIVLKYGRYARAGIRM